MFTSTQPTRRQSDAAIYGIATEGLSVIFLTIIRKGLLKSWLFGALEGDLVIVFRYFECILEMAMSKRSLVELEADAGPPFNIRQIRFFSVCRDGWPLWTGFIRTRLLAKLVSP